MKRPVLLVILWFGLLSVAAAAGVESLDFGGKVNEHRYKQLISQLRCLVCQNETLADSQADLAQDLRVEIYDMMKAGAAMPTSPSSWSIVTAILCCTIRRSNARPG